MADDQDDSEKTEDPSQKRLDDALQRGDVAKSQELPAFLVMFAITGLIALASASVAQNLGRALSGIFAKAHAIPMDGGHLIKVAGDLAMEVGGALALPFLGLMAAAIAGNMLQNPPILTLDPLTPNFSRLNPIEGLKRMFSSQSLVLFGKGLAKVIAVGVALVMVLWPRRDRLDLIVAADVNTLLPLARELVLQMMGAVCLVMFFVAIVDFGYQKFSWLQKHKMSLHEVKEEHKQQEGNPEVKNRLRQIRRERARRRMMSQVPKATVVITNPTHYAVALRYDSGMGAPICVAKGLDTIAFAIRKRAEESGVAVVENPPLARVLHASVDIDEQIPAEHYKAVAEVIGYVMNLKAKKVWTPA